MKYLVVCINNKHLNESAVNPNCKICNGNTDVLFKARILGKYETDYLKCTQCGFVQIENPFWIEEAYTSAITNLDIGLISRNLYMSTKTELIIRAFFNPDKEFLDYGGGYGMFVRLMRDKGFNFFRYDTYCDNLFANKFDFSDNINSDKYELVTSFEVFEHLVNPLVEIEKILTYSNSILFSTELLPKVSINSEKEWWYFAPETGQHIAFYTENTLKGIANFFNLNIYSFDNSLHLLTPQTISKFRLKLLNYRLYRCYIKVKQKKESLLQTDFNSIRSNQ